MLKREGQVQFIWTRNGDLFVKKTEGAPTRKIYGINDLKEFQLKAKPKLAPMSEPNREVPPTKAIGGPQKRTPNDRSLQEQYSATNRNKKFQLVTSQDGLRSRKKLSEWLNTMADYFRQLH